MLWALWQVQIGEEIVRSSVNGGPVTQTSGVTFADCVELISALFSAIAIGAVILDLFSRGVSETHQRYREEIFRLIDNWQGITQSITYKNSPPGLAGFLNAENEFLGHYKVPDKPGQFLGGRRNAGNLAQPIPKGEVAEIYRNFYENETGGSLAFVFRLQYQILKTIDSRPLPMAMKRELAEIYRSMLSDPELHLLLYFSLSTYVPDDYLELIGQYGLLDNLLFKEDCFIADRIPEIEYIPLYKDWRDRKHRLTNAG